MKSKFQFTFKNIKSQYKKALKAGYRFLTCEQYLIKKKELPKLTIINRVDVDYSLKKADKLREIFDQLKIKATFFIRLHAPEYNPFSFENYKILKAMRNSGHEIGYHSEVVDQAKIWGENSAECLIRDIEIINRMLNIKIKGTASHGGMTGLNNLDFWKKKKASDFGLKYEAYDKQSEFNAFFESFYVSDSEWTKWKCYKNGERQPNDERSLADHIKDLHPLIYLLIHSDCYFESHFYE